MLRRFVLWMIAGLVIVACGNATPTSTPTDIVVGMPYIPNVQFAHFYVAAQKGYFAEAGLNVTFDYNFENDVVQRIATANQIQFALASADSILLARAQGMPVRAVMATSQEFPVAFISKQATPLQSPADLVGASVGIPGRFGASYIGLQALLYAGGLTEADVDIQEVGFAQVAALREDRVAVVSGYANNEPIQLAAQGVPVNVLRVADVYPMASDHLIVNESLIADHPERVAAFVTALQKGMNDVIADPKAAHDIALTYIPEAKQGDTAITVQVLEATTAMWQANTDVVGRIQPAAWQKSAELLQNIGVLTPPVDLSAAYDLTFIK
jgi:NitT/TauT family transport system substrate-binding protein